MQKENKTSYANKISNTLYKVHLYFKAKCFDLLKILVGILNALSMTHFNYLQSTKKLLISIKSLHSN